MSVPSQAYYLDVQVLVRKWREFACDGDGIVTDDTYEAGSGKIWPHITEALCDREEDLSFKICLEDGEVEDLPEDVSFSCEIDGTSTFTLTDISGNMVAEWPPRQDEEVPSALLAPRTRKPERWLINLDIENGLVLGWPKGKQLEWELGRFVPIREHSSEIGIQSF